MAVTQIDIDVDDYLDDASNEAIWSELLRRIANGYEPPVVASAPQPWTRIGLASDIRHAFYARDASRLEMLLSELERHEDRYV
jgi:hypothetical protein